MRLSKQYLESSTLSGQLFPISDVLHTVVQRQNQNHDYTPHSIFNSFHGMYVCVCLCVYVHAHMCVQFCAIWSYVGICIITSIIKFHHLKVALLCSPLQMCYSYTTIPVSNLFSIFIVCHFGNVIQIGFQSMDPFIVNFMSQNTLF